MEKSLKTDSRPLEKKPGVALKDLLQGVAMGSRDDDTVLSLANRLVRLAKQLDDKAQARIEKASGGIAVAALAKGLISALNPDAIVQTALATARAKGITRSEETLLPEEIAAARAERVAAACTPFDKPELPAVTRWHGLLLQREGFKRLTSWRSLSEHKQTQRADGPTRSCR